MILAIDTGNTNIVFGCIDRGTIVLKGCISTDRDKTDMEYAVMFKNILDIHGIKKETLDGAIMSSVVPPLNSVLSKAVEMVTGHRPIMVNVHSNTGLKINMDDETKIGHDLLVDSVAALSMFQPPILIFDMGTATTISVIDGDGAYSGSVIIPGVKIAQEALTARTSQLPAVAFEAPNTMLGKNTIDAMQIGLIHGTAAMMDGMIERQIGRAHV